MPKKSHESWLEFKKRVLSTKSKSFCGAKWYNATIWLGQGVTASCHHPEHHLIPLESIKKNPKTLHNTDIKKMARKEMIEGIRPSECHYCWRFEDLGDELISDRVYKSAMFTDEELLMAFENSWDDDVNLRTLEISFDRTCNFACSYCSPSYSTTWASDIKNNGPYKNLHTDDRNHYTNDHPWAQPFDKNDNPYVKAFWEWWPELSEYLTELRVTGGEPLLSKDVWKLMELIIQTKPNLDFALNSNLVNSQDLIDKLIEASHKFKKFKLYTSCESIGTHAEYIRDGLKWDVWSNNLKKSSTEGNFTSITIMMTLNALCLYSITEFCDFIINLRKETGKYIDLSFNVMRYPAFQSIEVLPKDVRISFYEKIFVWFQQRKKHLYEHEIEQIERFLTYLKEGKTHVNSSQSELLNNFKEFYEQYDSRRNKNLLQTFPEVQSWI